MLMTFMVYNLRKEIETSFHIIVGITKLAMNLILIYKKYDFTLSPRVLILE